jgi:hypothetical protein
VLKAEHCVLWAWNEKMWSTSTPVHLFIVSLPLPHSLNPWSRVFLWKLIVFPLPRNSPQCLELNNSSPISQSPTTSPFNKPDWSNQRIQSYFLKICFNIILPSLRNPTCVVFSGFSHRTLYGPLLSANYATSAAISYFLTVYPDDIWWAVQITKPHTMQFLPLPR